MRNDDVLAQLRAVNPVTEAKISHADPQALAALREGITMTGRQMPQVTDPRRRIWRRGAISAVVAVALLGGGAAYATYQQRYVGGDADGIRCLANWADQPKDLADNGALPQLSGDVVADCQRYQSLGGRAPIADPVAFRFNGRQIYVAPRSQVPENATAFSKSTAMEAAQFELTASIDDMVDGPNARCLSTNAAVKLAQSELDRLGLRSWKVVSGASADRPCARVQLDPKPGTLVVVANAPDDPEARRTEEARLTSMASTPAVKSLFELRDALRTGIADKCVNLTGAAALATRALRGEPHWPLTTIEDPTASCTRVDMVVGGSIQVTLRGPAIATR